MTSRLVMRFVLPLMAAGADAPDLAHAQGSPVVVDIDAARPGDVSSVDAIVGTYYVLLSGPAGEKRDWHRFRSLLIPGARLLATRVFEGGATGAVLMNVSDYISAVDSTFTMRGYRAKEVKRVEERFGAIAQVFSTYEEYRDGNPTPYARGMNGIQLFHDGSRWWIVSVTGDVERPGFTIPSEYLPAGGR